MLAAHATDALVACGDKVRQDILDWAPAGARVPVIANGVPLEASAFAAREAARAELFVPEDAVAIGYDYESGKLILRTGTTERRQLPFTMHEMVWRRSGYWAMVALPPDRIPATADESRWLSAVAALERAGGPRAARTAYQTFLKRWPANVNAAVGLANSHHALGELKEAESVLRDAARENPESVIVLNNLAQTLSDQGRDAEALPVIERAAALGGPFSAAVEDTKRSIQKKLKR